MKQIKEQSSLAPSPQLPQQQLFELQSRANENYAVAETAKSNGEISKAIHYFWLAKTAYKKLIKQGNVFIFQDSSSASGIDPMNEGKLVVITAPNAYEYSTRGGHEGRFIESGEYAWVLTDDLHPLKRRVLTEYLYVA